MDTITLRLFWKQHFVHSPNRKFLEYFAEVWPEQEIDFLYGLAVSSTIDFPDENSRAAFVASLLWHSRQTGAPIRGEVPQYLIDRARSLGGVR